MSLNEHESILRNEVLGYSRSFLDLDPASIYRVGELGITNSFESTRSLIERITVLLRFFTDSRLRALTRHQLDALLGFVKRVGEVVGAIQTFSYNDKTLLDRDALAARLESEYSNFIRDNPFASAVILLLNTTEFSDVGRARLEELSMISDRAKSIENDLAERVAKAATLSEEILAQARRTSSAVALAQYGEYFIDEASKARTRGISWLVCAGVVSGMFLYYLIWLVFYWSKDVQDLSTSKLIQVGGAKIALFTVAFYLVSWIGRNFKAQWHNHVVNCHRANALKSLDAFANSARDPQTREAILIHASSAIFSQSPSGFIPDQSDAPNTPSILEIVRGKN